MLLCQTFNVIFITMVISQYFYSKYFILHLKHNKDLKHYSSGSMVPEVSQIMYAIDITQEPHGIGNRARFGLMQDKNLKQCSISLAPIYNFKRITPRNATPEVIRQEICGTRNQTPSLSHTTYGPSL